MKNFLIGLLFFVTIFGGVAVAGNIETHYTKEMTVVSIDGDEIIVTDKKGNEFSFYGDGFKKGDTVKAKFYTNGTDNTLDDDELINIK